ncbi:MAG: glycine cleavage T C-terminal barrel domain-containing protein [Pseudomonadota bacterium]
MAEIGPNTRLRASPFYDATVAEGVTAFSPYNGMLMPTSFGHLDAEYKRLTEGVALWDVAVERQVQIEGPDAARCTQVLCTRDLSTCQVDQGKYVAMCDHRGVLINDPIVLKISETCFWLSIADNNILLWSRAIAAERGFDVVITEPDVSPLAVQGPDAENVVAAVFGDWIRDIRFFWFKHAEIEGIPVKIGRSGYSKQGGFEIYLMDGSRGTDLWNIVREAGEPWGIGPGNPNPSERMEGGMLSFGGDTDDNTNPFEVRLGEYVDLDVPDDVIGIQALRRIAAEGPTRHQLGVVLDDTSQFQSHAIWYDVSVDGQVVGSMTCGTYSPKLDKVIGFLLVPVSVKPGDSVVVHKHGNPVPGTACELPFV